MGLFSGNAMWQLVRHSDGMSLFVLFVLLSMSVICWTIFLYKLFLFLHRKRQLREAVQELRTVDTTTRMYDLASQQSHSLPSKFIIKTLAFVDELAKDQASHTDGKRREWELLEHNLEQVLDDVVSAEETALPFLSTSAAVAPLLGLFGTVWGLVHAFMAISKQQTADIAAVAPGISQALITTLAGLMVAIPALVMYNYLQVQLRSIEQLLAQIGDRVSFVARKVLS